jgi:hypothetical protein
MLSEPPGADPHAGWCGRGQGEPGLYPIWEGVRGNGALPPPRLWPTSADPTGGKARGVKARYRGVCRGCGASTAPRNGKGDAYAYCKRCHPGAIAAKWTRERVREAMRTWRARYGAAPSSYDWSRTHARRRGGEALIGHPRWCGAAVGRVGLDRRREKGLKRLPH